MMKKTCANCRFFSYILQDPNSNFHIHYYCQCRGKSLVDEVDNDLDEYEWPVYDRIETGEHCCCYFKPRENLIIDRFNVNVRRKNV